MREWLANLAPRERLVLAAGAVGAVVIVLWGFVWMPLTSGTSDLGAAVESKRQLAVELRRAAALEPAGDDTPRARGAGRSLVVLVNETAQRRGLAERFTTTRPDGQNRINVSFQNAAFDTIVEWLLELERDYAVDVESASFNQGRERGLVTGQILLSRA